MGGPVLGCRYWFQGKFRDDEGNLAPQEIDMEGPRGLQRLGSAYPSDDPIRVLNVEHMDRGLNQREPNP